MVNELRVRRLVQPLAGLPGRWAGLRPIGRGRSRSALARPAIRVGPRRARRLPRSLRQLRYLQMAVASAVDVYAREDLLTGCQAVAEGVRLADVDVIAAYPIRPYTEVMDNLSKMIADGVLDAEYIVADSEHSQFEIVKHASAVGARCLRGQQRHRLAVRVRGPRRDGHGSPARALPRRQPGARRPGRVRRRAQRCARPARHGLSALLGHDRPGGPRARPHRVSDRRGRARADAHGPRARRRLPDSLAAHRADSVGRRGPPVPAPSATPGTTDSIPTTRSPWPPRSTRTGSWRSGGRTAEAARRAKDVIVETYRAYAEVFGRDTARPSSASIMTEDADAILMGLGTVAMPAIDIGAPPARTGQARRLHQPPLVPARSRPTSSARPSGTHEQSASLIGTSRTAHPTGAASSSTTCGLACTRSLDARWPSTSSPAWAGATSRSMKPPPCSNERSPLPRRGGAGDLVHWVGVRESAQEVVA